MELEVKHLGKKNIFTTYILKKLESFPFMRSKVILDNLSTIIIANVFFVIELFPLTFGLYYTKYFPFR